MHKLLDTLMQMRSAGLGHEAVIEILLAILALMMTALGLILAVLAIGIGIVGWFGYTAIRDAAVSKAKKAALSVAEKLTAQAIRDIRAEEQATMMLSQGSEGSSEQPVEGQRHLAKGRSRANSDIELRKEGTR